MRQSPKISAISLSSATRRAMAAWLKAGEIDAGPVFRRVIVRRYAARPARKAVALHTVNGHATWDMRKFAARDAETARIEYHVGNPALHPGSLTLIFRRMIGDALTAGTFGDLEKVPANGLIAGFSAHSTRVGLNQDLFAVGETIAGIMDALRWKTLKMPLAYNRNLAAEAGAAGRLLARLV